MSRIKKLIPKLSDTPEILKARQFIDTNFADRGMIARCGNSYLRAYLELEGDEIELADTLVQVLQHDYRYDTVSYKPTSHRIIIEWDPGKEDEMNEEARYYEILNFLREKSTAANVELCFETEEGETVVIDNPDTLDLLNQILEQAYLPFLTQVLVKAGYHKD